MANSLRRVRSADCPACSQPWSFSHHISASRLSIKESIGRGAFGSAFRARLDNAEDVVVKMLRPAGGHQEELTDEQRTQLEVEAKYLSTKRCTYVVRFYGFCREKCYLVQEYCRYRSLFEVMRRQQHAHVVNQLSNRLKWLSNVADAMVCLHAEPCIIHRDLNSTNVLLDGNWNAKVGDFGLARPDDAIGYLSRKRLIDRRLLMLYQPPEVIRGICGPVLEDNYSTKSDVFAFGVLMQEVLALQGPYGVTYDTPAFEIRVRDTAEKVERGELRPEIPANRNEIPGGWAPCLEPLADLINDCCATEPGDRPDFGQISHIVRSAKDAYDKRDPPEKRESYSRPCFTLHLAFFIPLILLLWVAAAYMYKDINKDAGPKGVLCLIGLIAVCFLVLVLAIWLVYSVWSKKTGRDEKQTSLSINPLRSLWAWLRSRSARMASKGIELAAPGEVLVSPFLKGVPQIGNGSLTEQELRSYPCDQSWKQTVKELLKELPEKCSTVHDQRVYEFCLEHVNSDSMELHQWQHIFIRHALQSRLVQETTAWKRYITARQIPSLAIVIEPPLGGLDPAAPGPSRRPCHFSTSDPNSLVQQNESELEIFCTDPQREASDSGLSQCPSTSAKHEDNDVYQWPV